MASREVTSASANKNTKLNSNGDLVFSPKDYTEQGATIPSVALPEYVPELQPGITALQTFERMYRNDAQIRATIRAAIMPVIGAEWFIDPFSPDPKDQEIADLVSWNLFDGMTITWPQVIEEAAKCVWQGANVMEKVWVQRPWVSKAKFSNSKKVITIGKLAPRPMNTIQEFLYDVNGGPKAVVHLKYNPEKPEEEPKEVEIPISKLLVFSFDRQAGDMRGNSILRSVYKHWYMKEAFYKIDGVQKERHGIGVPYVNLPPGYDEDDLVLAGEAMSNVRTNERAYFLIPPGWDMGFKKVEGNLVDALESAREHDLMIARNILVQFINMGSASSSGNRSVGAVGLDLFFKSSRHIANLLAATFNTYLIPQLVSFNFGVDRYPKLKVRSLGDDRNYQQISAAVRNLIDCGALTPDEDLEAWLRYTMDMPASGGAARNVEQGTTANGNGDKQDGRPPTGRQGVGSDVA